MERRPALMRSLKGQSRYGCTKSDAENARPRNPLAAAPLAGQRVAVNVCIDACVNDGLKVVLLTRSRLSKLGQRRLASAA